RTPDRRPRQVQTPLPGSERTASVVRCIPVHSSVPIKPTDEPLTEFLRSCADSATVISFRHFPQHDSWIAGCDLARMPNVNVAIVSSVDQKNWHRSCIIDASRGQLFEVEFVLPSAVSKCQRDYRAKYRPSDPRAGSEELPDAIVGNLAEV